MSNWDFCLDSMVVTNNPPEKAGSTIDFNGWNFGAAPTQPYQMGFTVRIYGLTWYTQTNGLYDAGTDPLHNARRFEQFVQAMGVNEYFTFPHPHLGSVTARFKALPKVPASLPNAAGLIDAFEVELVHHNPSWVTDPAGPPTNSVAPAITGTAQEGSTLSVSNGTWTNSPTGYDYQWKRGGNIIPGAKSSTYKLMSLDVGKTITCTVTAANTIGSNAATSAGVGPITALVAPVNTVAPAVTGSAFVGGVLSTTNGTWNNFPTSYSYQWKRNGATISGAISNTYTLVLADAAANITCDVLAANLAGSNTAPSNSVGPIDGYAIFADFANSSYRQSGTSKALSAFSGYAYSRTGTMAVLDSDTSITLGSELITNGTFATNTSGWTAGNSATLSSTGGRLRVTNGAGFGYAYQSFATVVGREYQLVFSSFTGTCVPQLVVGSTGAATSDLYNSTGVPLVAQSVTFVATSTTTTITVYATSATVGQYAEYDDISVKLRTYNGIDSFSANVPPINSYGYHAYGALTNPVTYSQAFDDPSWSSGGLVTVTANAAVAPDGTMTAEKAVPSTANSGHALSANGGGTIVAAGTNTLSVFVKAAGYNRIGIRSYDGTSYHAHVTFDLAAVTATATAGTDGVGYIIDCGNGWYRCVVVSGTMVGSGTFAIDIQNNSTFAQTAYAGDGTSGVYLWQAQTLVGNFPDGGPVISTTTASVTVGASDLEAGATLPNGDFIIWTVLNLPAVVASTVMHYSTSGAGSPNDQLSVSINGSGGSVSVGVTVGGVVQTVPATLASVLGAGRCVIMARRKGGIYSMAVKKVDNSIVIGADAAGSGSVPTSVTAVDIGCSRSGASQINGRVEGFYQKNGTFTDADITTILTAA